jgi:cytochrome c peroxidase
MNIKIILLAYILAFLSGCMNEDNNSTVDDEVSAIVKAQDLTGDPSTGRKIPSINSPKAQLGMKLFFTKSLGGDKDSACVSCHHPALGGGDNLSLSIGVAAVNEDLLGPGRTHTAGAVDYDHGYATTGRNAPSTYNLALWDRGLFWDYRVESMDPNAGENADAGGISTPDSGFGNVDLNAGANLAAAQARFPVTSENEMRGFSFDAGDSNSAVCIHIGQRLSDANATDYIENTWESEFETVYGTHSVTFDNIVDAIGEYERSQLFVNSAWKAYVQGNVYAISLAAKRGAKLFFRAYDEGGMNCVACHSGDFFTDESFHVMAIPQVGRGKENGVSGDDDFGRANVSGSDKYAFRTPTLLNVEVTGPWGHSGAYTTLEAVVRHMVDVDSAVAGYDFSQLDSTVKTTNTAVNTANALAQLQSNRRSGLSPHRNVNATSGQIADLVAFLKTLTDPCVKERDCIGDWIPENAAGPDALQLNAIAASGNFL